MNFVNEKIMLTFALDEQEIDLLNNFFQQQGTKPCIVVNASMADSTLKEILEGKEPLKGESLQELPFEKAIILNGFEGGNLQKAVTDIRGILASRPILAVVTPISLNMKFKEVLEHLIEEREFHKKNAAKKN